MIAEHSSAGTESRVAPVVARRGLKAWQETLLVAAFFVAVTVVMTWPWAAHMGEAINPFGDVVLQMTVLRWDAHALVTNPAGLFEAPFFYPYAHSLAFSEHLTGETLVALPFLLVTGNPALAYNINVLLSFVLTGLFTYLLVRDLTGSRAGGLLAGVAFAFCPFRFMQMGHLHMLATAWFPFTLWALFRMRNAEFGMRNVDDHSVMTGSGLASSPSFARIRGRFFLLALVGVVAMGLSSVYYTLYLVVALMLWGLWMGGVGLARGEWRRWKVERRTVLWAAVAVVMAGLVLLPVFLPYAQTSGDLGVVRSTYELENWSAQWSYFGKVLQSNWLYAGVLAPRMASGFGERELFFGIVPSVLAVVGLVGGRGRKRERFYFALLGILSLLLTFGLSRHIPGTEVVVPLPYAFFYDWLPGFKALRVPVRFAVLLDFSVYVLAGYGVARLVGWPKTTKTEDSRNAANPRAITVVGRRSPVVATLAIALVLLEFANPLDVSNRRDVTAQIATAEPYAWLARPENRGVIMELPFNPDQADVQYMLFETRNWQPIVNGWSGFVPPGTVELSRAMSAFPDPATVSLLQGLEVRHVVVHLWEYPKAEQAGLKAKLDATHALTLVNQVGDNYVYRVAPDRWLRQLAQEIGGHKTIWIGDARHGTMPTLQVLAYALHEQMGVSWKQMGGNINIGYRPIGQLPFGTFPDYAMVPNDPALVMADLTPVGLDYNAEALNNPAVRVLFTRIAGNIRSFDMTAPEASASDLSRRDLGFDDGVDVPPERATEYSFLAFEPSKATIEVSGTPKEIVLPLGVSRYSGPAGYIRQVVLPQRIEGNARLLRVEVGPARHGSDQLVPLTNLMPIDVTPSQAGATLDTRMRVVGPAGKGDFTATIDVYAEPWGTHPDGHFGSWSVVLPGDGVAHDYLFKLDPLGKTVTTVRDGQPVETFAWVGPPTRGDFRASLVVSDKAGMVANVPLYTYTLSGARLADWQLNAESLSIPPVR